MQFGDLMYSCFSFIYIALSSTVPTVQVSFSVDLLSFVCLSVCLFMNYNATICEIFMHASSDSVNFELLKLWPTNKYWGPKMLNVQHRTIWGNVCKKNLLFKNYCTRNVKLNHPYTYIHIYMYIYNTLNYNRNYDSCPLLRS